MHGCLQDVVEEFCRDQTNKKQYELLPTPPCVTAKLPCATGNSLWLQLEPLSANLNSWYLDHVCEMRG